MQVSWAIPIIVSSEVITIDLIANEIFNQRFEGVDRQTALKVRVNYT